ncbi:unnamed protein product [Blepharisma stoltei]|uniref:Tubby C-terminal domain-containing protein n=1 Tax=Blepharisma stoltei TaxID=1481888 RepID=A0AAU9JZJ5_9CILI|nr:unnamed protein product [Blepharisma stoltei]
MERVDPENCEKKVEVMLRSIHPNLNPPEQEGPQYNMLTYVEDFNVRVKAKILARSNFFKEILIKDKNILQRNKAIEIKLTSRKNQVSIESTLTCLDYLDHQNFNLFDIQPKTMLSLVVTASFIKVQQLEDQIVEYISKYLNPSNLVEVISIASQIKNEILLEKCYIYTRILLLARFGEMSLPKAFKDDKNLTYESPFLIYTKDGKNQKVSLEIFSYKAQESLSNRHVFHTVQNMYNLMRIERTRSEEGFTGSDYPHTFRLVREHDNALMLYAERHSDSGDIIICKSPSEQFSDEYIGIMVNNFWGNDFTLFDHGVKDKIANRFPQGFIKLREEKLKVKYESNILGDTPRSLEVKLWDEENKEEVTLNNVPPRWNERAECYTLNFYGRVSRASAKNFQLVMPDDPDTIYFMFGKISTENFHLDYRSPLSMFQAFAIGLASLSRKRIVA